MTALLELWNRLDGRRRGILIGGLAALIVVLVILTRVASQPSFALLYDGLEPAVAGEVVQAISAQGVAHRVEGGAIYVDARERDGLRLALASEGLPANGPQGYELLDSLSGFGTTSQMFDAAYWRAKEGELARTILASPAIRAARVHIANPSADPFQPQSPVTASITIRPATGGLAPGHAQALRFLVASSVPGLTSDNVTVVDAESGQVVGAQGQMTPSADAAARSDQLRQNIERLLAARVGPGNAVVQVAVELETARELIIERIIDPESRVVVSTETEDMTNSSQDAGSGVTVASNLPEGDATGGDGSSAQANESRERVTFDLSETQRELQREPGAIRRITAAVLLNGVEEIGPNGAVTVVPRSPEEVEQLTALVRSAVGFEEARGDIVTVESLAFDAASVGELVEPGLLQSLNIDIGRIIQTFVLAAVALAIAFGVLRPMLNRSDTAAPTPELPGLGPVTGLPSPDGGEGGGEQFDTDAFSMAVAPEFAPEPNAGPAPLAQLPTMGNAFEDALPMMMAGAPGTETPEDFADLDPVERLRRLIQEREEETVQILRSWMNEDEGEAR